MNNFFDEIPFFCNFKHDQKSIFEVGKKSFKKLPEMQFHEKKFFIGLFDFTSFFAWTFVNILGPCEM